MSAVKIAVIGAGSAQFTAGLINDLCRTPSLAGSHVALMDISEERLGLMQRLGERYLEPVRETAERYYLNQEDRHQVHIVATELRGYAGVLGAATMANQNWKREH